MAEGRYTLQRVPYDTGWWVHDPQGRVLRTVLYTRDASHAGGDPAQARRVHAEAAGLVAALNAGGPRRERALRGCAR